MARHADTKTTVIQAWTVPRNAELHPFVLFYLLDVLCLTQENIIVYKVLSKNTLTVKTKTKATTRDSWYPPNHVRGRPLEELLSAH